MQRGLYTSTLEACKAYIGLPSTFSCNWNGPRRCGTHLPCAAGTQQEARTQGPCVGLLPLPSRSGRGREAVRFTLCLRSMFLLAFLFLEEGTLQRISPHVGVRAGPSCGGGREQLPGRVRVGSPDQGQGGKGHVRGNVLQAGAGLAGGVHARRGCLLRGGRNSAVDGGHHTGRQAEHRGRILCVLSTGACCCILGFFQSH